MTKVFGIGLNKTGTKTLGACLHYFGFKHLTYHIDDLRAFSQGNLPLLLDKITHYDSCEDWPWALMFDVLDKHFPNSQFILTKRQSPEIWFESLCRHADRTGPTEARRLVYGYEMPHHYRQYHIDFYNVHNKRVLDYFQNRPGQLLEVCWETGDGWHSLCEFLNQPHPQIPFPHLNKSNPQLELPTGSEL